jgi:hypothetical protein
LAAADVTGDGRLELLAVKTGDNPATAVYSFAGSMMPGWPQITDSCNPPSPARPCYAFGGYNQNIGAADMDGDGVDDVVSSTDTIYLGIFKGSGAPFAAAAGYAPKVVPSVPAYHDPAEAKQGWGTKDRSEFTDSPPVMADLDGSGKPRLVLLGDHEHAESTLFRGHTLWVLNGDLSRPAGWEWPKDMGAPLRRVLPDHNIVMQLPQPSVGELDGEPGVEILAPASDGKLHVYHSDGTPYWSFVFGTQENPYIGASEALVADINGDGVPEVLFATFVSGAPGAPEATPRLYVLSSSGAVLHAIPLSGRGSMAAPSVADLDGDGQLELVISLKDAVGNGKGAVQIWKLPGSSKNCVQWATARGNWLRTGTPGLR